MKRDLTLASANQVRDYGVTVFGAKSRKFYVYDLVTMVFRMKIKSNYLVPSQFICVVTRVTLTENFLRESPHHKTK